MELTYEYECSEHGELVVNHSIKEDRSAQRCPVKGCRKMMNPLISFTGLTPVFKGYGWPSKDPEHNWHRRAVKIDNDPKKDPLGNEARKHMRDPVAVR